jgi:hypothetical protein
MPTKGAKNENEASSIGNRGRKPFLLPRPEAKIESDLISTEKSRELSENLCLHHE